MKLLKVNLVEGEIKLLTGLHIGGSKDTIEIGGLDQPIVKHPLTEEPYIPGSSIKGKMRSLIELAYFPEKVSDGRPCNCGKKDCPVCTIFGTAGNEKEVGLGPTRLVVRDAFLTKYWKEKFEMGDLPMEEKYETAINRIEGTALRGSLRPIERVPSGVSFGYSFTLKIFDGDDEKKLTDLFYKGMRLIELDALGGQSSRGSGQIKFDKIFENGEEKPSDFLEKIDLGFE